MSDANTRQVGGQHYSAAPMQHWDMAILAKLPYLEGQITKYIARHTHKNKLQDLQKAAHFLQKLREAATDGKLLPRGGVHDAVTQFLDGAAYLHPHDVSAIIRVTSWSGTFDLDSVAEHIKFSGLAHYGVDPCAA